tara:strand:+ start:1623 stop:1889 length:267 start_codon:yes stop_codon:yes gene_type:complete
MWFRVLDRDLARALSGISSVEDDDGAVVLLCGSFYDPTVSGSVMQLYGCDQNRNEFTIFGCEPYRTTPVRVIEQGEHQVPLGGTVHDP